MIGMTSRPIINRVSSLPPLSIQSYERYLPTAFDESLTILQKINKIIQQLNHIGQVSNDLVKQWNDLMDWIVGNGLTDIVSDEIDKRIADGRFDQLIYSIVGDLRKLETVDKTDMVNAMNEVNKIATENDLEIGDISKLITEDVSNLVNAINELKKDADINRQAPVSIGEATGYGVISGLKVTQQEVLAMAVEIGNDIDQNIVHLPNGIRYTLESIALPVKPSHATLNRRDIVYVNKDGIISYLSGTNANNPITPDLPEGSVLLAEIIVNAKDTTVNDTDIVDKRELKSLNDLLTNNKSNIIQAINEIITSLNDVINNAVGNVGNLQTKDKTTVVNALNEVVTNIGNKDTLNTSSKDTIVNAINELLQSMVDADVEMDERLTQSIHDSITNVLSEIGERNGLNTLNKNTIVSAINEVLSNVGDLNDLNTTVKTSVVESLNEVLRMVNENVTDVLETVTEQLEQRVKKEDMTVNVKDFGAIGNGIADDTNAIINAINSLKGDGSVYFPTGRYNITRTINLKSGVSLYGDGLFSSVIQTNIQNLTMFAMLFPSSTGANLSIENLQLYCLNTGIKGFVCTHVNRFHLRNIAFFGCDVNVSIDGGGLNRIDDCISCGTQDLKSGQIWLGSTDDTKFGCVFTSINNYRIENNGKGVVSPAIHFRRAVGVRCNNIITNDSDYTGTCLLFENDCQGITVENSIIVGYNYGAIFRQGSGVQNAPVFCTLSNVDFDQCLTNSILINEGNWLHFKGGHITSSRVGEESKAVVVVSKKSSWIRFDDIQIGGYRKTGGAGFVLIDTEHVSITGCLIDENDMGIALDGVNTNLQIKDNTILRTTFPIAGNPVGNGNVVMNNHGIRANDKVGTPTLPKSDVGIKNTYGYPVRIFVTGGAVNMISIDEIGALFNGGMILLMPNETLKINYAEEPNWNWIAY